MDPCRAMLKRCIMAELPPVETLRAGVSVARGHESAQLQSAKMGVLVGDVHDVAEAHLFKIIEALGRLAFGFGYTEGREEHAGQDGDDHQQFDEGEGP
jgi:hypothetical protein